MQATDPAVSALESPRQEWLALLWKIAQPVLEHAGNRSLKLSMPIRVPRADRLDERMRVSHLEACGRTLAGLAPWLVAQVPEGPEAELQKRARQLAQSMMVSITDPQSPDYLNFKSDNQPLVDAAYLAQGILRAPQILWNGVPDEAKKNIVNALILTRRIKPYFNNWLLFSAMIEAFLCRIGANYDSMRIDYALRQMDQWYVGDGFYADGPQFHLDYYNSYVIHPFLIDILGAVQHQQIWNEFIPRVMTRAQRHAVLLERMISPEGTMPVTGRSLSYRCGTLHALAQLAASNQLPASLAPAAVRTAMTAVIRRSLCAPGTFDDNGWLNVGHCGSQPGLAETYISTGSLYLSTLAFLPLGMPPDADFWREPDTPFSSQLLYAGADLPADKALVD